MDYATAIGGVAMFTLIIMGLVAIIFGSTLKTGQFR